MAISYRFKSLRPGHMAPDDEHLTFDPHRTKEWRRISESEKQAVLAKKELFYCELLRARISHESCEANKLNPDNLQCQDCGGWEHPKKIETITDKRSEHRYETCQWCHTLFEVKGKVERRYCCQDHASAAQKAMAKASRYSKGLKCSICKQPICDTNSSGLCTKCKTKLTPETLEIAKANGVPFLKCCICGAPFIPKRPTDLTCSDLCKKKRNAFIKTYNKQEEEDESYDD